MPLGSISRNYMIISKLAKLIPRQLLKDLQHSVNDCLNSPRHMSYFFLAGVFVILWNKNGIKSRMELGLDCMVNALVTSLVPVSENPRLWICDAMRHSIAVVQHHIADHYSDSLCKTLQTLSTEIFILPANSHIFYENLH